MHNNLAGAFASALDGCIILCQSQQFALQRYGALVLRCNRYAGFCFELRQRSRANLRLYC